VVTGTLFGVIGVALGYITRSMTAVVGAVGWVLFVELAILHSLVPHLAKWLVTGAASSLTDPGVLAAQPAPRPPPSRSSAPTPWCCWPWPPGWCCAATSPDLPHSIQRRRPIRGAPLERPQRPRPETHQRTLSSLLAVPGIPSCR
jgi:hypothetical protein